MAKTAHVMAIYKLNEAEYIQVSIPVINSYPDVLAEAKRHAVEGVKELLTYSIAVANAADAQETDDE